MREELVATIRSQERDCEDYIPEQHKRVIAERSVAEEQMAVIADMLTFGL